MTCAYVSIGERSRLLKTSLSVPFNISIENRGKAINDASVCIFPSVPCLYLLFFS